MIIRDLTRKIEDELTHNERAIPPCSRCNAQFFTQMDMKGHMKKCSEFMCPACKKPFEKMTEFGKHVGKCIQDHEISEDK